MDEFVASLTKTPVSNAFRLLQAAGIIVMTVSGIDKFFNILADWQIYLSSLITLLLPLPTNILLYGLGIIEIAIAGIMAVNPKIGGLLGAFLHFGIIINLLLLGDFYNIAVVDFGLMLAYLALWQLSLSPQSKKR